MDIKKYKITSVNDILSIKEELKQENEKINVQQWEKITVLEMKAALTKSQK